MEEIEARQKSTIKLLELWIKQYEKPRWFNWLGLYPAMASVEASKAQLKSMRLGNKYGGDTKFVRDMEKWMSSNGQ
jgi:hypothetical protein